MKFLDGILIKVFVFLRSLCGIRPRNGVDKIHQIEEFLYVVVQGCLAKNEHYSNIFQPISLTPVIRIRCPTFRVLSSWKSFESSFFTEHTLRKITRTWDHDAYIVGPHQRREPPNGLAH